LVPEKTPVIYIDDHYFHLHGKDGMRQGIIARVRLEEWDKMIIRPTKTSSPRQKKTVRTC